MKVEGKFNGIREEIIRSGKEYGISLKNHISEYTLQNFINVSFDYETFKSEVKIGQAISIYLDNKESKMIAQIKSEGKEFISNDVRNRKRKTNGLFALVGGIVFVIMGVRIKTKHNNR